MITWENNTFYLETAHTSYIMRVLSNGTLTHLYYGPRLPAENLSWCWITGDYRQPALVVENADGRRVNSLVYHSHRILDTKPHMPGLPQPEAQAPTLEISLWDETDGYEVTEQ